MRDATRSGWSPRRMRRIKLPLLRHFTRKSSARTLWWLPVYPAVASCTDEINGSQGVRVKSNPLQCKSQIPYTSWFGASSELAPNMFGASSEIASVMEFGFNQTSCQSNLTYGRIAAAPGGFSCIRQVAPICTPYSTPQSASAPYRFCPLLSHFEYIDRRTTLFTL